MSRTRSRWHPEMASVSPRAVKPPAAPRWLPESWLLVLCAALAAAAPAAGDEAETAESLFVRDVRPILAEKCWACHGSDPDDLQGGLDLRSRDAAATGGDSGEPALVVGRPADSPLYLAVSRESDSWSAMPPKENDRLSEAQLAAIRTWIERGADWPSDERAAELAAAMRDRWDAAGGERVGTSGGLSAAWTDRPYDPANLWAYRPLPAIAPPVRDGGAASPIDAFLLAAMEARGLKPAALADRRTLIRRATFDLTGLPPTPEEIEAFERDPASDDEAFSALIERLLASPHYGEQSGRRWLDVVRYADSSGYANDYERGNAWRYRDYVVRSFNEDKPYDRFVLEQIAGDELDPDNPELLVAAGFLRMGPWELTGMEVPKVARQRFLDDTTDAVGQVFLGQMLQCARCHDHKFDPVPTRDYYAIQAALATTQLAERRAAFLPDENTSGFEEQRYVEQRREHYQRQLAALDAQSIAAARKWYAERCLDPAAFEDELRRGGESKKRSHRPDLYEAVRASLLRQGIDESQIPPRHAGFTPQDFGIERIARKGLERLKWIADRYEPYALSVYSGRTPELNAVLAPLRVPPRPLAAGELERTCILAGGDPFSPTEPVQPGVLSAVESLRHPYPAEPDGGAREPAAKGPATAMGTAVRARADAAAGSGSASAAAATGIGTGDERRSVQHAPSEVPIVGRRLALARWIANAENPLTARVMANRVWQGHFGKPLAGNPHNFGATGKKPTHPELLDWLAGQLITRGWSVKELHRLVMMSAAYRRSTSHPAPEQLAELDPDRESYAVFLPRRLDAEELRDAMLAASGELNREVGGIPVRPEMNREAALQPRQVMGTFAEAWQPSPRPDQRHRRSLYAARIRGQRDPFFEVFNAPSPDLCCEARESSTVTPQVFALMNSEITFDRALAFARRLTRERTDPRETLQLGFLLACGRAGSAVEIAACLDHWQEMTQRHAAIRFAPQVYPREVVREALEENTGERFTFVEPLESAADFEPDLKPADAAPELRGLAEVCLVLLNSNEFAYVY